MGKMVDLTGQRFGRLTAKKVVDRDKSGFLIWECECSCPKKSITNVRSAHLTSGIVKGCGCLRDEANEYRSRHTAKTKLKRTSKHKGVSWHKKAKKWQTHIMYQGKSYWLGNYNNEIEAAEVYNTKAVELFGEDAVLNDV